MTKQNRLRKAWERNWELWIAKGVYYNMCVPIKYQWTPKEVYKDLKREDRNETNSTTKRHY